MAENLLIDLAQTVMIEKYGLEEETYKLFKFSETAKTVTIGMTDDEIPVSVTFPREFLRFEEMKRWDYAKKELFIKGLIEHGKELPEELKLDREFHNLYIRHAMETGEVENATGITLTVSDGKGNEEVLEPKEVTKEEVVSEEETAEDFESKVEGKKKVRKLKVNK
jgi:hypothetical protein